MTTDERIDHAIDIGGGQTCDIQGVRRKLQESGFVIVDVGSDLYGNATVLQKIKPGEPFFVLRGQDKLAVAAIRQWANSAEAAGVPKDKVDNARACAWAMRSHRPIKIPD